MVKQEKQLFFYGWVVVALAVLANLIAYALRYNFSLFYVAILDDFGWSREATAVAFSINLIIYGISAPMAGGLFDKFGIRRVIPFGAIILGVALAACSEIETIWQFYLVVGLSSFGSCAIGFVPHVPLIANWFFRRRGLAIGIVNAGIVSGMLLAPPVQHLISTLGWRGTFLVFASFSVILLAPLAAIFQRQRPADKGLAIDGAVEAKSTGGEIISSRPVAEKGWLLQEWTMAKAVKGYRFWCLILLCAFLGLYQYTFLVHQVAYLTDAGYTAAFAAGVVATLGALTVTGSVCTFLSDRMGREVTFTLASASALGGVIVFMLVQDTLHAWMPYLYAVIFGFPYGINTGIIASTSADLFQGKHFGAINGVAMSCFVYGGAIGSWFAGRVFNATGSYTQIFPLVYFAIFASVAFIWLAAPRKVRPVLRRAKVPDHGGLRC